MKKFVKISLALTLSIIFCISGCSNNKDEAESSVENVSVVSTVFSTYEKNMHNCCLVHLYTCAGIRTKSN